MNVANHLVKKSATFHGNSTFRRPFIIHIENPTRCHSVTKFYFIFIWSSTCFGRHTAHHQEPKTALAASGFADVEGCWTCGCWTLSAVSQAGSVLHMFRYRCYWRELNCSLILYRTHRLSCSPRIDRKTYIFKGTLYNSYIKIEQDATVCQNLLFHINP